jgi:hypothetical protein
MIRSTGNDIVALQATDPERTGRFAFYSRILSAGEQTLFRRKAYPGLSFDRYVWLLWSIKESVYKYEQRVRPDLVFSPVRIELCTLDARWTSDSHCTPDASSPEISSPDFYEGMVVFGAAPLYSRSILQGEIIATVVSEDENFTDTCWGFTPIGHSTYAEQSSAVRTLAVHELSTALSKSNLRIEKTPTGIPVVSAGEELLDIPISLAHHDRYVAWSYVLPAVLPAALPACRE